nr:hypothetical protein [Candidatus Sigynarchaeota archaeon]
MSNTAEYLDASMTYFASLDGSIPDRSALYSEYTFALPVSDDVSTLKYVLIEENSLFDYWYWSPGAPDAASLKGTTADSLYEFLMLNGGTESSLLQVRDANEGRWIAMLDSIDNSYILDVLKLDTTAPVVTFGQYDPFMFQFLYYDGASVVNLPAPDLVSLPGQVITARFGMDFSSFQATNGHAGFIMYHDITGMDLTAYYENQEYGQPEIISVSQAFSATFSLPAGFAVEDIDSLELLRSFSTTSGITQNGEIVTLVRDSQAVGCGAGVDKISTTMVGQSFCATREILDSMALHGDFLAGVTIRSSIYRLQTTSIREVATVIFPSFDGMMDEQYLVVESTSGVRLVAWFDKSGDGTFNCPITADDYVRIDIEGLTDSISIAARFVSGCAIKFGAAGLTVMDLGDGMITITQLQPGPVPD